MKRFIPPLLNRRPTAEEPPVKKPKLEDASVKSSPQQSSTTAAAAKPMIKLGPTQRKPLLSVKNPVTKTSAFFTPPRPAGESKLGSTEGYYNVLWYEISFELQRRAV